MKAKEHNYDKVDYIGGFLWTSFITSLGFLVWALSDVFGTLEVVGGIILFSVLSYYIGKRIGGY